MARTGYKITVYLDDNPNSSGYMETYEERVLDENTCPISEDDLVLVSSECEVVFSGKTGYRINTYYNRTTGEYQETKELDPECEASTDEEIWVPSGDPFCETTEQGVNTGYMVQIVVQENRLLPNYGETKQNKWLSPECGANNCAIWDDLQQQCHISVANCVATFDGTADVTQIDINPLSATYNQTRTINKQDSNCENCTQTTFSWQLVGDMCGNDELLCSNGLQQVATNSYTVHRKYKTIGNSTPVPMDEYQIVLKIEDDEDCGYIRPMYEMRRMPGEYLCDFETYTKYEKYSQYVSYDSGVTWSLVSPEVSQRGDVIAYDSYDCGKPMYRWVFNGEYTCEDNGDDGKLIYWDSNGVMTSASPCSDSSILDNKTMTRVTSGITSPDGYKDTYQVGDCVDEIADKVFEYFRFNDSKLWLGNYTEKIGYRSLCAYDKRSLDIPEMVSDMSHESFGRSSWLTSSQCWEYNCGHENFRVLVMHPTTPPTMEHDDDMPNLLTLAPDSASGAETANSYNDTVIFVPFEAYDSYCNADIWSRHATSERGRMLPMDNDTVSHKAILEYESDFSTWRYYVPDGESASTIGVEEHIYGKNCITGITITDKVTDIADSTFISANSLKTLDLGNSVETIGYRAFYNNGIISIDSVTLPASLSFVDDYGLGVHTKDLYVNCAAEWKGQGIYGDRVHVTSIQKILDNTFDNWNSSFLANSSTTLYVGDNIVTDLVIPYGTTEIGQYTFGKLSFNTVTVPNGVTISENAFTGDIGILTIPSGATVSDNSFKGLVDEAYLNTMVRIPHVGRIHVPCSKLLDYNELYFSTNSSEIVTISELDECSNSPYYGITLYGVENGGTYGDNEEYAIFREGDYLHTYSGNGTVTYKVIGKTISLYYQTTGGGAYQGTCWIRVEYNGIALAGWNQNVSTDDMQYYSNTFDILSDGENIITIELISNGAYCQVAIPLNVSSQTRVMTELHQENGENIVIRRPINLVNTNLKWSDVEQYSSTTTSITVYDCTSIESLNYDGMEKLQTLVFNTVNPPQMEWSAQSTTKPYRVIVPCEGYLNYLNSYSGMPFVNRIEPDSYDCLTEEWVVESSYCDAESGKMKTIERKYLRYGDDTYKTDETRNGYGSDCISITDNGFTYVSDNKYKGCNYATMDFEYLLDGGLTVTIEQQKGGRPYFYVLANTSIYDDNGTLVATTDGHGTIDVELESNKKYHVTTDEVRAGGCGGIKFNF